MSKQIEREENKPPATESESIRTPPWGKVTVLEQREHYCINCIFGS